MSVWVWKAKEQELQEEAIGYQRGHGIRVEYGKKESIGDTGSIWEPIKCWRRPKEVAFWGPSDRYQ